MNDIIDVKVVEPQTAPSATTPVHTDNDRTVMHVLYGLHIVAWASAGMLAVIALVVNYIKRGEEVDPSQIYFRCSPRFETASPALRWISERMFTGTGARFPDAVAMRFWELM